MEKSILITILLTSIVALVLYLFIMKYTWNKKNFDKITASFGLLWAIFSIIISCAISLASIKEANLIPKLHNGRYMDFEEELFIECDNEKLSLSPFPDFNWGLYLKNVGNKVSNNTRVKISFENLVFYEQAYYRLSDHIYGEGGYSSLIYDSNEWLPPTQKIYLPPIDFSSATIRGDKNKIYMNISIITEDDNINTFSYKIKVKDTSK